MSDEEQQAFPDGLLNQDGMTLRDYFAAKAMSGMMVDVEQPVCAYIAKQSYAMADAMLIQRNKS